LTAPEALGEERRRIEAAQRDPTRFAELYEAHFERVYAYAVRRVRDRHEAEDVTAEVFHQALANVRRFEWREVPFAAWLFRARAGTERGGREAAPVPRRAEPPRAHGSSQWLSEI